MATRVRDAVTGTFAKRDAAKKRPRETVTETVKGKKSKSKTRRGKLKSRR